jgi:hypothetical protein
MPTTRAAVRAEILGTVRRGYTVEQAARFLQYDPVAVEYWLRTGCIDGQRDARSGEWRVTPAALIAFLKDAKEPMPTGTSGHSHEREIELTLRPAPGC